MKKIVIVLTMLLGVLVIESSTLSDYDANADAFKSLKEQIEYVRREERKQAIIEAIIHVESRGNEKTWHPIERAAGCMQIRPIMVREVNRLVGYKKYTLNDRWSREKSVEMFIDYQNKVNPSWGAEKAAKLWNGGINGMRKKSTEKYWKKIKEELHRKKISSNFVL